MSPNGDSCRLTAAVRRFAKAFRSAVPDRAAVRDAVLLARRGHDTLLVERRRGGFRAVIIDRRTDRSGLRIVARPAGGGYVLAKR